LFLKCPKGIAKLEKTVIHENFRYKGGDFMGGSICFHKPAGRWYIQIYWEGKRYKIWKYNGDPVWHEKTAQKLLSKIRAEIDENTFQPKAYFPDNPLSINDYSKKWLKVIDVKPNTLKDYAYSIKNFIIPFFGEKDLRNIRYNDLVEFHKWIPRCEKGKYNVVSCLRTIMRWAWRNEDIQKVPPFPKLSQGELPEIEYLGLEQQEAVLVNIPERDRSVFMVGMEYGLRIGELRAIQWDCVKDDEIVIRRAFAENTLMESTKTNKSRTYGLTPYVKQVLKALPMTSNTFVFVRDDGKPYTDKNLNVIWSEACQKAGIRKIKLYNAIRHSLGCQLLDKGFEFDKVQKVLGHTRPEMTKRYAKRSNESITQMLVDRRAEVVEIRGRLEVNNKIS
jgi:integrase